MGGKKIVFVDDDPLMTTLVGDFGEGKIETYNDPGKTLENVGDAKVLVSDLVMPGMKGHELIAKAKETNPGLKAFLFTLSAPNVKEKGGEFLKRMGMKQEDVFDKTEISEMLYRAAGVRTDVLKEVPYLFPETMDGFVNGLEKTGIGVYAYDDALINLHELGKAVPDISKRGIVVFSDKDKGILYSHGSINALRRTLKFNMENTATGEDFLVAGDYPEAILHNYNLSKRLGPGKVADIIEKIGICKNYLEMARRMSDHRAKADYFL